MTDEQIVEALAEKVMGWEYDEGQPYRVTLGDKTCMADPIARWSWPDGSVAHSMSWNPLTSDANACALLDKMAAEHTVELVLDGRRVTVRISNAGGHDSKYLQRDDGDRRRAICLAALKAVGVEVEA